MDTLEAEVRKDIQGSGLDRGQMRNSFEFGAEAAANTPDAPLLG